MSELKTWEDGELIGLLRSEIEYVEDFTDTGHLSDVVEEIERRLKQSSDTNKEFQELKKHCEKIENENSFWRDEHTTFDSNGNSVEPIIQHHLLPVIPEFVVQLVNYTVKVQHTVPSDIIEYFFFKNERFSTEDMNLPNDTLDLEKLSEYFELAYHRFDFEKACIIGYRVDKTQSFD